MIEVFKTNVTGALQASLLVSGIEEKFPAYKVNFDLDDCDRILRIQCAEGEVCAEEVIALVHTFGCIAEVLPDDEQILPLLSQAQKKLALDEPRRNNLYCRPFRKWNDKNGVQDTSEITVPANG